jgi:hypothetical protein
MNFLKTGDEGRKFFNEERERQAEKTAGDNIKNWRFKLNKGATGYIIFFDNLDTFLLEHQFQANGSYYNYETCIRDIEGECPLC